MKWPVSNDYFLAAAGANAATACRRFCTVRGIRITTVRAALRPALLAADLGAAFRTLACRADQLAASLRTAHARITRTPCALG